MLLSLHSRIILVSAAALLPLYLVWTKLHSNDCDEKVIMTVQLGAASAKPNLANTVAMKTVSSNHVAADQVFRNITTLPHLHIYSAVRYVLM